MKIFAFLSLACALLLGGCATTPAHYDYDRTAVGKMAGYDSFMVIPPAKDDRSRDVLLSPLVDKRIERAINQHFSQKGLEQTQANPDFRVVFHTVTKTKQEFGGSTQAIYRRSLYFHYRERYFDYDEFDEGTFVIDIIDEKSDELVWRGTYVQRLGWAAPDASEVQAIVDSILSGFPPTS